MSRARKLCPQGTYLPPRFERYREISQRIREIFLSYTSKVEPISLDEAFLDLTETTRSFEQAIKTARRIKEGIKERWTPGEDYKDKGEIFRFYYYHQANHP